MQHYTKNTVSVRKWCKACNTHTDHRVDCGRVTNVCIPCQEKAEADYQQRLLHPEKPAAVQEGLFRALAISIFEEMVRAVKMANAKQQPLFFKTKEEEFVWHHEQLLK